MNKANLDADSVVRAAKNYQNQITQSFDHNREVVANLLETFSSLRDYIIKSEQTAQSLNDQMHERREVLQKIFTESSDTDTESE